MNLWWECWLQPTAVTQASIFLRASSYWVSSSFARTLPWYVTSSLHINSFIRLGLINSISKFIPVLQRLLEEYGHEGIDEIACFIWQIIFAKLLVNALQDYKQNLQNLNVNGGKLLSQAQKVIEISLKYFHLSVSMNSDSARRTCDEIFAGASDSDHDTEYVLASQYSLLGNGKS